jgi:hypothetical protein
MTARFFSLSIRWGRVLDTLLLAASVVSIIYLLAHLLHYQYGRDQGIYAVVGEAVLGGDFPYRDAWDFKPPGIYFVYALARALFGGSVAAIRVLEALAVSSMVVAFALFSRRHTASLATGIVGGAAAVLTYVQMEFWHTGQPESFGAVALAWALVCSTYEPDRSGRRPGLKQGTAWALAGALYAGAALLKPPLGGGFVTSLALVAGFRWSRERTASSVLLPAAAFLAGAVAVLAAVFVYLWAGGALTEAIDVFTQFVPRYAEISHAPGPWPIPYLRAVAESLVVFSPYVLIGLIALAAFARLHDRERIGVLHVAGVVAFGLAGIGLQAKFFPYHYGAVLPLLGLLTGWGLWKIWVRARRHAVAALLFLVAGYLLHDVQTATKHLQPGFWSRCDMRIQSVLDRSRRTLIDDLLYSVSGFDRRTHRLVADWLRENVSPDERVLIWGFEPDIYVRSGRRPSSRFFYNVPLRVEWSSEWSRPVFLQELESDPPAAVVIERNDRISHVLGHDGDSVEALNEFDSFRRFVLTRYHEATVIGDFKIFLLRR